MTSLEPPLAGTLCNSSKPSSTHRRSSNSGTQCTLSKCIKHTNNGNARKHSSNSIWPMGQKLGNQGLQQTSRPN